jgi:hypothetical protein
VLKLALTSVEFVRSLAILLLTVALSGVIVPGILNNTADMRSRQDAIRDAQAKLLEEITYTITAFESLMLDVSWYRFGIAEDKSLAQKAWERYNERSVDLITRWRVEAVRARNLASPAVGEKVAELLTRAFREQDDAVNKLYHSDASASAWARQHQKNIAMAAEAEHLLHEISDDLHLSRADLIDRGSKK